MKKRPNLILREPVKLYEAKRNEVTNIGEEAELILENTKNVVQSEENFLKDFEKNKEPQKKSFKLTSKGVSAREKMSPRVQQIWNYFCKKANSESETVKSFSLTRAEVMKEAGIGSTNTYRDALKKFQELNLMTIELRPGVNTGSIFSLTEKGIEEVKETV